ncbi:hypothetical protein Pan44_27010 [Caulifigura coniformis]|uniref:Uncharacterized protein n=1 Tax=Caulifigura coniformis TaxID=2527983 RepID=A0A517SEV8_9PLAN|nr:phBC6A51 family helix-turn-helix protein [Caulifigura coniformis]QDT54666.1 hypothetical protein Pan44_27010 [Caulifigura coniformis]
MDDDAKSLLRDIADSLRIIAAREQRESKQEKAVRLLVELGPDNVTAIARAVGVNRSTLYRWKTFADALERMHAAQHFAHRSPRFVSREGALL